MKSRECNGGFQPAGWKGRDGRMWFPTMKGVVVFNPQEVAGGEPAPPVILEEALIGRRLVDLHHGLKAPPGSGQLEFRYAAIGFHAPERIGFKYRLEGFDQDWVDAGARRTAYYTNIPPGSYRFQVIAGSADGAWNMAGAAYPFSLAPHFYQTAWFSAICVLGLSSLALAAHAMHTRRLRAREKLLARRVEEHTAELRNEIAERERVQRDLIKAKTAEQASRVKREFLANMSHEMRTPMNGVLGMVELTLGTELTTEQKDYLTMARSSAKSLLTIINDILDFSKIEAGRLDLEQIDYELQPMLEETVGFLAFRAGLKSIELACDFRPGVPQRVRGDPTRLRQILLNLLGNAVKFTERGEVVMSVECEARDEHGWELHFVVRDTGIGIPSDKQKVIFEAFSQADSSTTRKFGGTGLGLAISSRLVHMMAGRIWVNSRVGEGSEFHFTVRLDVAAEMAEPVPTNTAHLAGARVLVVDDSHTSRRILAEILDRWGMRTVLAASGEAGWAALEAANAGGEKFGLVLLDVNMPGMDGFLLLEAARKTGSLATAAVVMLTSGHQPGDAARCRELGAVSYLAKPIRQQDLLKALLEAVGRTSVPTPTESATGEAKAHNRVGRPLHILLAEDNPVNQRVALGLLQKRGHSVIVAGNGREALDALRADRFDVVLMDVQMPVMDGFETTAAIRENEKNTGQHVPIIAMTAHAMKGDAEICLQAGMDDYVSKPVQPARLFQVVEKTAADLSPAAA
jgi:signal transduction histidine kinase/CheY-like chemotaxis protein